MEEALAVAAARARALASRSALARKAAAELTRAGGPEVVAEVEVAVEREAEGNEDDDEETNEDAAAAEAVLSKVDGTVALDVVLDEEDAAAVAVVDDIAFLGGREAEDAEEISLAERKASAA